MSKLIRSRFKFVSIFLENEYISVLIDRREEEKIEEKLSKKVK